MADVTVTDSNYASAVKSSYDDVNSALENLLGNVGSGSYASKSDIANLQNQLNNFVGTNPVGTILPFGTSTVPTGYLLCNGASFDTNKYNHLYTSLNASNVPDLRGMFLRGLDTTGTADRDGSSRALLSFQEGSRHFTDFPGASANYYAVSQSDGTNTMSSLGLDPLANGSEVHTLCWSLGNTTVTIPAAQYNGRQGLDNGGIWDMISVIRPKNVAVNYIIKAVP